MIVGRVLQRGRKVSPNMVLDGRWRSVCVSVSVCVCVGGCKWSVSTSCPLSSQTADLTQSADFKTHRRKLKETLPRRCRNTLRLTDDDGDE